MNYIKDWLMPDLRCLEAKRSSLEHIQEELARLKLEESAIKATDYDKINVSGGDNHQEDKLITNIAKREELSRNYEITKREVTEMDMLLSELDEEEREIMEKRQREILDGIGYRRQRG